MMGGGVLVLLGMVRHMVGTAPDVLLRVLWWWVRLESWRARFLMEFVDIVTWIGALGGDEVGLASVALSITGGVSFSLTI